MKLEIEQEASIGYANLRRAKTDLEHARKELEYLLIEQTLSSTHAAEFARKPIEELIPVRRGRARLEKSVTDVDLASRRLGSRRRRNQELETLAKLGEKLDHELDMIRRKIEQSTIRCDAEGVILTGELHMRVGDQVLAGERIIEIAELRHWQAELAIMEHDMPKVESGQQALLYINAFPHLEFKVFKGIVSHVPAAPGSSIDGQAPEYRVKVEIEDPVVSAAEPSYSLVPGMRVEGSILVERDRILGLLWKRLLKATGKLERKNELYLMDPS